MRLNKLSLSPLVWTAATLAIGLAASVLLACYQKDSNTRSAQSRFEALSEDVVERLQRRIQLYEYGLRGARAVVVTAGEMGINPRLFRQYTETRNFADEFPGARGFGFIRRVPRPQTEAYLQARRADGLPDFAVKSLNEHTEERFVIEYIEPVERNRLAQGLDIGSEANRRQAAVSAMQTGKATITGPITLIQAAGDPQRSVLFLLPVYRSGATPAEVDQRESNAFGWTYAPLALSEVLADFNMAQLQYDLSITDFSNPSKPEAVFDSRRQSDGSDVSFHQTLEREIYGRLWRFNLTARPEFVASLGQFSWLAVLAIGGGASLLIALLVGSARVGVERKRKNLLQQAQLATIVENSADAIVGESTDGKVIIWNPAAERLFGYERRDVIGQPMIERMTPEAEKAEEQLLVQKVLSQSHVQPADRALLTRSGAPALVSVAASPIRDEQGEIIGIARFIRDIQDRLRAEKAVVDLAASLEKQVESRTAELETARHDLQTVLDSVPSMIGYWDKNLRNRVANRAYTDWFGMDARTLFGKSMVDVLGGDLLARNQSYIDAALRGERQQFERSIPRPDGRGMRHALTNYLPDIVGGEVRGFYVIVHDVTEVVESRQAISKERERLTHIIEGTHVGTWEWNAQTGEIIINERWAEIIGYSLAELSPTTIDTWKAHAHPDDLPQAQALLDQHFKGINPQYQSVMRMRHKQGHWVWIQSRGRTFTRTPAGEPEWMYGTHQDITAAKEAEVRLQEVVAMLGGVLSAATQQSIIATDKDGIIKLFNTGAEKMLGYTAQELVGISSPAPLHLREEVEAYGEELSQRYGYPVEGFRAFVHEAERLGFETREWTYVRKDGHQLRVQLSVNTIRDTHGDILGYLGIAQDMTERHRQDRALRHAKAAAETASTAKSMFLANMSHEIRTPMNAVLGVAHLLADTSLDDDQRQLLKKLQIAGRSLLGIINDILDISKIEAGEMTTESVVFPLPELINELVQLYSPQAEAKGVVLQARDVNELPVALEGDPTRLRQVLSNLVGNAIKFTQQGSVRLEVERVHSTAPVDQRAWLKFSVIDTGEGVPESATKNLFTPFAQADTSTTRRFGGTGLGLSIVKRMAQLMGGDVGVESVLGQGSTFWVQLPFALPDETEFVSPLASKQDRLTVFIADDNEIDLEGLTRMCQAFGWRTTAVASGTELVHRMQDLADAHQALPDALVVDWKMPGLDGIEALGLLADRLGAAALPATLVVSAHERNQVASHDRSGIVNRILTKPVNPSTLFNAVNASVAEYTGNHDHVIASTRLDAMRGSWLQGLRILLVDDSDINLEVARRILEKEGATVEVRTNGREAVEALKNSLSDTAVYDAVLMDVQMPIMDGYEATSFARRELGMTEIPIIALTAGALSEERRRAEAAGMDAFLTKPLDPALLVRTLHKHVSKRRGTPIAVAVAIGEVAAAQASPPHWPEIEGIDAAVSMKLLQGDEYLFVGLLQRFVNDYGNADFELPTDHSAEARAAFIARVHKLRGSSGMLGAKALHAVASTLEAQLRDLDNQPSERTSLDALIASSIALLNSALQQLTAASSKTRATFAKKTAASREPVPAQAPDVPAPTIDEAGLQRIHAFVQLLERQDLAAMGQVDAVAPDLLALMGPEDLAVLIDAVQALDFSSAQQTIAARLPERA
ncbi:PAS domain S-box protein [Acidovorax sp.]|uniref:PAS domain S-box protein n=1 Tax=Acidovorax sp. TaxID=1872122 RepID=UPI0027BAE79A|nr:PAS domain S-box protein [Acidovorax sp.]